MFQLWLVLVIPPVSSVSHTVHTFSIQCVIVVLLYTGTTDLQSKTQAAMAELKEEYLLSDTCSPTPTGTGDPSSILSESQYTHVHKLFNVTVVLLYTGIDDLLEVKMFVKQVVNWKDLGLALGLAYSTLQKIEKGQHHVVDDCMRDMLAAWLQQQDNVTSKGTPSWRALQTALRTIAENELANKIST